jgi:hypothetical protein
MSRPKGLPKIGGRVKGTPNKRTRDFHAAVSEAGLTPLAYMLSVLRDESVEPERRDEMAKAAAPYIHPRLANIEAKIDVTGHEAALAALEELGEPEGVVPSAVH